MNDSDMFKISTQSVSKSYKTMSHSSSFDCGRRPKTTWHTYKMQHAHRHAHRQTYTQTDIHTDRQTYTKNETLRLASQTVITISCSITPAC